MAGPGRLGWAGAAEKWEASEVRGDQRRPREGWEPVRGAGCGAGCEEPVRGSHRSCCLGRKLLEGVAGLVGVRVPSA